MLKGEAVVTRRDQYQELADPVKIGLLMDGPPKYSDQILRVCELVAEQYKAAGRFERGFEFIPVYPWGPPAGFIRNTIDAFNELCDKGCLAVIGGTHSDDCIALPPYADARETPYIAMGATRQSMSKWSFAIGWGSCSQDGYVMASWLRKNGYKRVVMTWDHATHCEEYVSHFRNACVRAGIEILADHRFPQILVPELDDIVARVHAKFVELKPDALASFASGPAGSRWCQHVTRNWDIPRVLNGAFYGAATPEGRERLEGWVGTTMWDDDNPVAAKFAGEFKARYPEAGDVPVELLALSYDVARALIEGVIHAPILTPDGVRRGLEMIEMIPAACGGPRTCIGFNAHAHLGHKGADVMVLRRVKNGQNIMEGRAELF